jgi:hypothetical protein
MSIRRAEKNNRRRWVVPLLQLKHKRLSALGNAEGDNSILILLHSILFYSIL